MFGVKPLSDFAVLDNCFSTAVPTLSFAPRDKLLLNLGSPKVTIIRKGTIKIARSQEELLVSICPAPMIIGLPGVFYPGEENYQITALAAGEFYQLDVQHCADLLTGHQLWREAFNWVSWLFRMLELRDIQLIGKGSYSQIRATLQSMAKWEPTLRARIGVMNYIQQRTHISRSVIAEVLAALRAGKYIEMDKGKLIAVNRLPLEY
ncbi:transcriptional regulator [Enterobacteriaceae bacterium RIT691]|nr:transcriptional regulator [Enterobacteriaceae bacterium RIT691]